VDLLLASKSKGLIARAIRFQDFQPTGWAKKTGLFLRVDNFATVGGSNACDMSKSSKFYPEKNLQLAYQCVKYFLPNFHKYSMSLKLR